MIWLFYFVLALPVLIPAAIIFGWVLYLALMNLAPHRDTLHPVVKAVSKGLLVFGYVYDCLILNFVIGSLLFLEPPKIKGVRGWAGKTEWMLTDRLKRWHNIELINERNYHVARWICTNLLNKFDPKGDHC